MLKSLVQKHGFSAFLFLYFYLGWFGCIYFAKSSHPWVSAFIPLFLGVFLAATRSLSGKSFGIALLYAFVGAAFDGILGKLGFIHLPNQIEWLPPLWLLSLWLLFSFSMIQLGSGWKIPLWLQFVLGFFMGPLTYKSGEYFEVLQFSHPMTFWVFAVFWSLAFPLIITISKRVK